MTHTESAAIRVIGIVGWEPCIFEAAANGSLIRGGIPTITFSGKKKWPAQKNMEMVVITDADVRAEYARYENETGNCGDCYGTGKKVVGWHYIDGEKTTHCVRCNGKGGAPS